ncbi:MAG TPA: hypothetical protein VJJ26_01760 [Candidatus Babeliales bacterium]|nr:hypothetical protein [Candidatus Babeliales bacterium]
MTMLRDGKKKKRARKKLMHPHDIIFRLSNTERLVVDLEMPFETLPCFCQITISFYDGFREYILNLHDHLEDGIRKFRDILEKSLKGEMRLHKSLTNDLGYLHNECLKYALNTDDETWQLNPNLTYDEDEIWIGYNYQLWACGQWAAWMYNNENGEIIFEITPRYPGFCVEEGELVAMPAYEKWMESYHFAILRVISREIAQKWLTQADGMLDHIKEEFNRKSQENGDSEKMIYEDCPRNK